MTSTNSDLPNNEDASQASESPEPSLQATPPSHSATTNDVPSFGWSSYAERVNGRFAMIGFAAVLIIEVFSHEPFLRWAGLIH